MIKEIQQSEYLLNSVSTDFGKIFNSTPIACAIPKNKIELCEIVKECNLTNTPIIPRGMSHSASGQCLVNNGVVIDMKHMDAIHEIEFNGDRGYVKVSAGITWERLVKECLKHNAAPRVLTDWQKLTVGGTLSTGGLGFMSHLYGIQANMVMELEVITGNGELIICSPNENKDLFDLVRGGLGQYGIIVTATIIIHKAPKLMHTYKLLIQDSSEFHNIIKSIWGSSKFQCIHSFLIPNETKEFEKKFGEKDYKSLKEKFSKLDSSKFSYYLEVVQYEFENENFKLESFIDNEFKCYEVTDFFEYITKDPPLISTQKEKGTTAHPELALFIPKNKFKKFISEFMADHKSKDMGEGPVLIMPISSKYLGDSSFVGLKEDFYFIGILRNAFPNTTDHINHLTNLNEHMYHKALEMGAKRYPCDSLAFPKTQEDWSLHFGDKWNFIKDGKQKFDSNKILRSLLTIHN